MVPSWLRQVKKRISGRGACSPIQANLNMEALEDRLTPAVDYWTGYAIKVAGTLVTINTSVTPNTVINNDKWSIDSNWLRFDNGTVSQSKPQTGDDIVFPDAVNTANNPAAFTAADAPYGITVPPATGFAATFSWPNNSEDDMPGLQINNLTILGDGYHIDAFLGDTTNPNPQAPDLTITGKLTANIAETIGADTGVSYIGSFFGPSSMTLIFTGTAQTLEADSVGVLDIETSILQPPTTSAFYVPGQLIGIQKTGTGTMELSGQNAYAGSVDVKAGTLIAANQFALGTASHNATVENGATLGVVGAVNADGTAGIMNSLSITGDGVNGVGALNGTTDPLVTFSGAVGVNGGSIWTGNITMSGSSTIGAAGSDVEVDGVITGAGNLSKAGTGTLTLTNANAYTGQTFINVGTVVIENNDALATTAATGSYTQVASGATLGIYGNLTVAEKLILTGDGEGTDGNGNAFGALNLIEPGASATWTGSITLLGNTSIGVTNSNTLGFSTTLLTITGALGGAFDLSKVGQGTLRFPNANTGFSGNVNVHDGILDIANGSALGTSTATAINVTDNVPGGNLVQGTLQIEGTFTVAKPITLNGQGYNSQGALHVATASAGATSSVTLSGPITLNGPTTMEIDTGSTLATTGSIGGTATASLDRYGLGTFNVMGADTFLGALGLREGTTNLYNALGFGPAGGAGTEVYAGATLAIPNPLDVSGVKLTVSGTGVNSAGAVRVGTSTAGTTNWSGLVNLLGLDTTEADFNIAGGSVLNFSNVLSGDANLVKFGTGVLDLTGTAANQFVKTTYLNDGVIALGKSSNVQALSGAIIVGDQIGNADSAVLRFDSSNQIPSSNASVIVNADGLLNLNNNNELLGGVTALSLNGGDVATGTGTLYINGNLGTSGSAKSSTLSGTLNLNGVTRTLLFVATPAITLTTSRSTASVGQAVTFTFTGTANTGVAPPSGTVTFYDNGVTIIPTGGTAASPGVALAPSGTTATAMLPVTTLTAGNHTITALYSGDGNYPPELVTLATTQVIIDPTEQVLLSTSGNPLTTNQQVTFTYQISGPANTVKPTGTVQFFDNGVAITTGTNSNGTANSTGSVQITYATGSTTGIATLTVPSLTAGAHVITATYSGDTVYSTSTTTLAPQLTVGVIPIATMTTNAQPAIRATDVKFTVKISGGGSNSTDPEGTVTFFDTYQGVTTQLGGPFTLVNGTYTYDDTAGFTGVGTHVITAQYTPATGSPYTSAIATLTPSLQVVDPLVVSVSANQGPNPDTQNGNVQLTFRANGLSTEPTPQGNVEFEINGGIAGFAQLVNGVATTSVGFGVIGTNTVTAVFIPSDNNYATATATMNPAESVIDPTTALVFTSNNNSALPVISPPTPALPGAPVTFSVSAPNGGAFGTVTFTLGGQTHTSLLNELIPNGPAVYGNPATWTFPNGLPSGTYTVTATFTAANGSPVASTTTPLILTPAEIVAAPLAAVLSSSLSPAVVNTPVTYTFTTVRDSDTTTGLSEPIPTGTVTFRDNGTVIGTATLINGVAKLTVASVPAGNQTITATYGGNSVYQNPTTATLTQVVAGGSLTQVDLTSSANSAVYGSRITYTYTASGNISNVPPTGTVTFEDNGTPIGVPAVLVGGVATITTNILTVGVHNITAVYSGDSNYAAATQTLSPQQVVVNPPLANIYSDVPVQTANGTVNFTVNLKTITIANVTTPNPTGSVNFFSDGVLIGTAGIVNGVSTLSYSGFTTAGTHVITATYSGDANYEPITLTLNPNIVIVAAGTTIQPLSASTSIASLPPNLTVNGTIAGTAASSAFANPGIIKTGVGNLTLNGTSTYTGSTTQAGGGGFITLTSSNSLPNTPLIISTGTVELSGTSQTVSSLSGQAAGVLSLSGGVLTNGSDNSSTAYQGVITGAGSLKKVGTGALTLSGASPGYTGTTSVSGGVVLVNANQSASTAVAQTGGTVGGNGTIANLTAASGGVVDPGAAGGIGQLTVNQNAALAAGSTYAVNITGTAAAPAFNELVVGGAANISGANLTLNVALTGSPTEPNVAATTPYTIIAATTLTGTFATVNGAAVSANNTFVYAGRVYQLTYSATGVTLTVIALAGTYSLTSSENPAQPGDPVSFTATFTRTLATDPTPTGTVNFYLDGSTTPFASVALTSKPVMTGTPATGTATTPAMTFTVGNHVITATYTSSNTPNAYQSASASLVESVSAISTTSVTTSASRVMFSNSVTFTAQVSGNAGVPTGTVAFYNANTGAYLRTVTIDANGTAQLTTSALTVGATNIQAVYSGDGTYRTSSASVAQVVTAVPLYAASSGPGGPGVITAFSPANNGVVFQLPTGYAGGFQTAVGDVNGDGYDDLVVVAGPGSLNGLTAIFSGKDFSMIALYNAAPGYTGALNVAVGDLTGDGIADVIFGTATGADLVFAYVGTTTTYAVPLFSAFGGFGGGVTLAAGDVLGLGHDQIIVGAASQIGGAGVFDQFGHLLQPYYISPVAMNGVNVAAGDLNGDGHDDLVLGARDSTLVLTYNGASQGLMGYFFAYPGQPYGVTVATVDPTGSGFANIVTGFSGNVSAIAIYTGLSFQLTDINGQPAGTGGTTVGGSGSGLS